MSRKLLKFKLVFDQKIITMQYLTSKKITELGVELPQAAARGCAPRAPSSTPLVDSGLLGILLGIPFHGKLDLIVSGKGSNIHTRVSNIVIVNLS